MAADPARIEPREGEPHVYSVTELAKAVNLALEEELPYVLVQGEITGWRPNASGHIYFSIKDENSQISVSLFRARIRREHDALRDGVAVQIEGRLEYWGKGGKLSLIAERVSPREKHTDRTVKQLIFNSTPDTVGRIEVVSLPVRTMPVSATSWSRRTCCSTL